MTSICEELKMRTQNLRSSPMAESLRLFPVQSQLDLRSKNDLSFSCVGNHSHHVRGPKGVHGGRRAD